MELKDLMNTNIQPGEVIIVKDDPTETVIVVGDRAGWPVIIGRIKTKFTFWRDLKDL